MEVVLRTVRGLEWVTAAEARGRLGAEVVGTEHREVWARADAPHAAWLDLRTVDDALLLVGTAVGLDHTRRTLQSLTGIVEGLDWEPSIRSSGRPAGPFDVVASFLGRRNFNRFEVEAAVGDVIGRRTGRRHLARTADRPIEAASAMTVRVHLVADRAYFAVRLGDGPLHRRPWKLTDQAGTLRAPLAAALAMLAGIDQGSLLLDPCAGAGTIPIEAALLGQRHVLAGDLSAASVSATRANAERALVAASLRAIRADAGAVPFDRGSVDRVATNVPWDRTVATAGLLRDGPRRFTRELARVLGTPGRAVLLVADDIVDQVRSELADVGLVVAFRQPVAVAGARSTVVVATTADSPPIDATGLHGAELEEWLLVSDGTFGA